MGSQDTKAFSAKISATNTDTQIFIAPWRARRRYFLTGLIITNEGASAATVKFYDKDANSTTPLTRGDNASLPLLEFIVPATNTLFLNDQQIPKEFFQAGMMGNSNVANVVVMAEVQDD